MLDSGSDFPFLYFAGVGALEESCQKLPWLHDSNKKYYGSAVEKTLLFTKKVLLKTGTKKHRSFLMLPAV